MIDVHYIKFDGMIDPESWNRYFSLLPPDQQKRNSLYRRWQDRQSHLLGRVLVYHSLKEAGYTGNPLYGIKYTEHSRPFIDPEIDFNISHSGDYVVCAIGRGCRLGIDIERCDRAGFEDLENVMNKRQWEHINGSESPGSIFYKYWAMKESVIKADGRGLFLDIAGIDIEDDTANVGDTIWHLNFFQLDQSYAGCVASDRAVRDVRYVPFNI